MKKASTGATSSIVAVTPLTELTMLQNACHNGNGQFGAGFVIPSNPPGTLPGGADRVGAPTASTRVDAPRFTTAPCSTIDGSIANDVLPIDSVPELVTL